MNDFQRTDYEIAKRDYDWSIYWVRKIGATNIQINYGELD